MRASEFITELNVKKTFGFVKKAHAGQQYGDKPYWTHPRKVAAMGKKIFGAKFNNDAVKVAFLHDVVEDTRYTIDQIARMGYSPEVVEAVRLLTKNKNLTYKENIKAIIASGNRLAIMVKYADNYSNYTGDKSTWEPSKAASSQKKYKSSMDMLGDKLKTNKHQELEPAELDENFADGKNPGRKGLAKRSGVNCKSSISTLRNIAKNSSGEKQRMAHWCANMKSGKQ